MTGMPPYTTTNLNHLLVLMSRLGVDYERCAPADRPSEQWPIYLCDAEIVLRALAEVDLVPDLLVGPWDILCLYWRRLLNGPERVLVARARHIAGHPA